MMLGPRRPERTLLHRLVREHLETFLALAGQGQAEIEPVPTYAKEERNENGEGLNQPSGNFDCRPMGKIVVVDHAAQTIPLAGSGMLDLSQKAVRVSARQIYANFWTCSNVN